MRLDLKIVSMYPYEFQKFLGQNGVQGYNITTLQFCYENHNEVPSHMKHCCFFATYIVVGGMPDVVQTYVDTHDIER